VFSPKLLLALMASTALINVCACATTARVSYDALLSDYHALENRRRHGLDEAVHTLNAKQLDRRSLIHAVLDRNPSVESVRQAWSAALARYRQAGAYEDPMVMASFAPLSIGSSRAPFGYDLEISQRIPLGGKLDAQSALAAAQTQAAASDYADARLKLALITSELYDDYVLAVRSLEVQAQHIELMATLQQHARAAYESGNASAQDSLQAEAELARIEYQRTVYETQRDVAIAQINALLHRDPRAPLPEPAAEVPVLQQAEPDVTGMLQSVQHRPDIASAQAQARVARLRVTAAEREFYPDLTVSTSYSSMWSMPEHRWMAGVAINVPLQRERRRGAVDEARAMRAAADSDVQSTVDAAQGEIAIALRQLQQARRAVQLYEQRLVPVARAQIEAARAGFVASQNNFMTVIEAERGLRAAELELAMARAELGKRGAALDRALGRIPGLSDEDDKP
jgi:outer membrane protein, heavy metal efflux system